MYTVYDDDNIEYDDEPVYQKGNSGFNFGNKKTVIIVIISVFVIIIGFLIYRGRVNYHNSYEYLEVKLKEAAVSYVANNGFVSNNEYFIKADNLNVPLKDDCNGISGVFVNNGEYTPYLMCDSYESKILNNSKEYIELNGKEILFLPKNIDYVESSYLPLKDVSVKVNGEVGREEGVYNLSYSVINYNSIVDVLKRKVVVINDSKVSDLYPTINLKGSRITYLNVGDNYIDEGVVGIDIVDGILSNVQVESNVNVNVDGEYKVKYIVTNSRGYANAVTRSVVVARKESSLTTGSIKSPTNLVKDSVTITVSVFGDNYAYTVLPDMSTTKEKTFSYEATNNGEYSFVAYDTSGKSFTETVKVDNIYKILPTGSCIAEIYPTYTNVKVTANSGIGISNYRYIVNNISSGSTVSTSYTANQQAISSVSVKATDIVGNEATINCALKQMDPTIGNNNVTYLTKFGVEYVVVNTKSSVEDFEKAVKNRISQSANTSKYGDACLGFAEYYVCKIVAGSLGGLSADNASEYNIGCSLKNYMNPSEQKVLKRIFSEINEGFPVVLMVNGNAARTSRHFVMAVGYKRNVYSGDALTESDLLIIDAWGGNLRSMDQSIDGDKRRTMFAENGEYRIMYKVR